MGAALAVPLPPLLPLRTARDPVWGQLKGRRKATPRRCGTPRSPRGTAWLRIIAVSAIRLPHYAACIPAISPGAPFVDALSAAAALGVLPRSSPARRGPATIGRLARFNCFVGNLKPFFLRRDDRRSTNGRMPNVLGGGGCVSAGAGHDTRALVSRTVEGGVTSPGSAPTRPAASGHAPVGGLGSWARGFDSQCASGTRLTTLKLT